MSEWLSITLGECCEILDNQRVPINSIGRAEIEGEIPYYGANGIQGYVNDFIFNEPLILIAEDGGYFDEYETRPIAYRIQDKSWVNNHAHVLRARPKYNQNFIFYALEHKNITPFIKGGTRAKLNQTELKQIEILSPESRHEQIAIANTLETVHVAIKKAESLIAKYQQIKAGLMHDLFTRGVTADGKLRPPREQAPELYRETPIGWIPKVWDMSVLDQLCNIIDPQPDHRTPPEQYDGIPYIGIGDFDAFGDLDATSCRRIVVSTYLRQVQRFSVEAGDVIYGKIGTIGQPKKLPNGVYALSANILLMKPVINREFFLHALNTRCFEKQISDVTNTTSQPALGIEKVRKLQLPNPALSEQKIIAQYLDQVDLKLAKEFSVAQKLKKEKAGLMHDLLTGQVRVAV